MANDGTPVIEPKGVTAYGLYLSSSCAVTQRGLKARQSSASEVDDVAGFKSTNVYSLKKKATSAVGTEESTVFRSKTLRLF